MEFRISEKKKKELFVSIFQLLKNSTSLISANVLPTGLHIQGMDKSHVCLFDLTLASEWFDYFQSNQRYDLCFDSTIFHSMITTKSDEQYISISLEPDDVILSIKLINNECIKKGDFNKYFTLPLMEYDYTELGIPDFEYDVELSLPSKKIADMLSQLSNFGTDLCIHCEEESVEFIATDVAGGMKVIFSCEDMTSYAIVENEVIDLSYSLTYITKMCISNKISSDIEFNLSKTQPMKIIYNLGNNSSLMFHISTKLTDASL
jgi:proliferating cell nuclear antigen